MKRLFSESTVSLHLNSFWLLLARLSSQGLAVVFIALVARRLAPASFGQFTFIAATVLIGNTFTSFGTDTLLIREIAKARQVTTLVHRAFTLQILLSAIWCLLLILLRVPIPLLIFSFSLFPLAIFSIVSALLRAFERMDLFWGLSLGNGFIQILCAVFVSDLFMLCILLLIGNVFTSFLALRIFSILMPGFRLFSFLDFRPLLPIILPFAALSTLGILSQRLGILSTSILIGDVATGLFSSAARILDGMKFGHYAILGALLPLLSRGALYSKQNYRLAFVGMLAMSILLAGGVTLLAHPIIYLVFGEKYTPAVSLLVVMVWCLVPYTISAFLSVDLVARGEENILLKATILSLAVWIIFFVWWITSYGLAGAAWATLIGEIFQAMILLLLGLEKPKAGEEIDFANIGISDDVSK
ncbi:MAG TPA: oligosaccharide flippase family protein [Anaerolineales bacterium]|nr:oligosaccharide flippase family protein [Anaerolineales bacterium]